MSGLNRKKTVLIKREHFISHINANIKRGLHAALCLRSALLKLPEKLE